MMSGECPLFSGAWLFKFRDFCCFLIFHQIFKMTVIQALNLYMILKGSGKNSKVHQNTENFSDFWKIF
jgi:hypothetical protein